jgi:hypothetical protein
VPLAARRILKVQDAPGCRILYISSSEDGQLEIILAALDTESVLTVGDMPEFTRRGGMVQFLLEGNRVRFELNLSAARRANLNLSVQLLKLATAVRKSP